MRRRYKTLLVVAVILAACAGVVAMRTLMVADDAEGWHALFDGKSVAGWLIEGDRQIADGALILGGQRKARAYLPLSEVRNCTVKFQYRTEGKEGADLGWDLQNGPGIGIRHFSPKGDWHDSFVEEYYDLRHPQQRIIRGQHGANGVFAPIAALWVEVPVGNRLFLRDIRVRQLGPAWPPWLVAIPFALASLMFLLVWRTRKARQPDEQPID